MTTHDRIANPATGERIEFREVSADVLRFEYVLEPGGFAVGKIDHAHPNQDERIAVREGRLGVRIDGDEWTATPGTEFAVPPRTTHTVWNDGDEPMRAIVELRPALEMKAFFETMFGLARDGKTNRWGLPGPLQLAVLADGYSEELYFRGLPPAIQRAAAAAVAPVGRAIGYRDRYPRYVSATVTEPEP